MVCEKCEKKLSKITTPDPFRTKARNKEVAGEKQRPVAENKLLSTKKDRYQPYREQTFEKCRICRKFVHQVGSHYCQSCAYSKGICAMCGKKILDIKKYKQSSV